MKRSEIRRLVEKILEENYDHLKHNNHYIETLDDCFTDYRKGIVSARELFIGDLKRIWEAL